MQSKKLTELYSGYSLGFKKQIYLLFTANLEILVWQTSFCGFPRNGLGVHMFEIEGQFVYMDTCVPPVEDSNISSFFWRRVWLCCPVAVPVESWWVGSSAEKPCVHCLVGTVLVDLFPGHCLRSALLSQAGAQLTSGLVYCVLASLSKSF